MATDVLSDLAALLASWELSLRGERKSAQTVKSYGDGVRKFLAWAAETNRPPTLDRATMSAFVTDLLDAGAEPSTARSRQLAVRRFSAWLADEGEIPTDELERIKPVKLDAKVIEPLTDDEIKAMIKASAGRELRERRDEALIRFMVETGTRAGETAAMELADVHYMADEPYAIIRKGKGGKGRVVPFGSQTATAIDRYVRGPRRLHKLADSPALWLGDRGKPFSYDGLHKTLGYRARLAGIEGFHPHKLRHTAAHRWLAKGGSEGGLMAVAGWTRPDMLLRYTRAQAGRRASDESRKLNLGEF